MLYTNNHFGFCFMQWPTDRTPKKSCRHLQEWKDLSIVIENIVDAM
jgi:hypothetical protein